MRTIQTKFRYQGNRADGKRVHGRQVGDVVEFVQSRHAMGWTSLSCHREGDGAEEIGGIHRIRNSKEYAWWAEA